jgi:iron complex outermembrane receptor protein
MNPKRLHHLLPLLPLFMLIFLNASGQEREITGSVTSATGSPLPATTVQIAGTTTGTTTDNQGKYTLEAKTGDQLEFTSVGYEKTTITVGTGNTVNVTLKVNKNVLGETVVTALGVRRDQRSLGYAISTVKGGDLVKAGQTLNPFLSLYGKAAGVGVNIGAAGPEGGVRINIRGAASMNPGENTRPLFVVDGVILSDKNTSMGSGVGQFDYGSGINDINADDIQSIEILKGAKATVLYGSDAANGVVLITTKDGSQTRGLGMTASFQYAVEHPVSYMKFQNEYGLGESIYDTSYTTVNGKRIRQMPIDRFNFGPKFDGSSVLFYDSSMVNNVAHPDNYQSLFQNGLATTANVAIAGSNDKGNMRAAYTNYYYQDITNSDSWQKRNTFSFNGKINVSKLASFQFVTNIYNVTTQNRRGGNAGMIAWGMPRDYAYSKVFPLYTDSTGYKRDLDKYGVTNAITQLGGGYLWPLIKNRYKDDKLHIISSAKVTLHFTPHVFFVGQAGVDYDNTNYTIDESVDKIKPVVSGGLFGVAKENTVVQTYQGLLNYENSFMDNNIHLFAFVGGIYKADNYDYLGSKTVGGLNYPDWYSFANEVGPAGPSNEYLLRNYNRNNDVLYSALGSVTLSWKYELYMELQGRQDWNSTLPPGNNKYFYPGVSLTWNYTERFNIPKMNRGQLRFSWANVGTGTSDYYANYLFDFSRVQGSNAVSVTAPGYITPEALKPERKREFEAGINNSFFDGDRLIIDFSYYTNNRYDQIMGVPISSSSSSNQLRINAGNVKNWGYELSITGTPVMTRTVRWDLTFNAASQHSRVVKLYPDVNIYQVQSLVGKVGEYADVGQPFGEIKMFDYQRDSASGQRIVNSSGLYGLDQQKYINVANVFPKIYGGIFSDVYFKGFDLHIGIDYKFGGTIFSITNNYLTGNGQAAITLNGRDEAHGGLAYYINDNGQNVAWQHDKPAPADSKDGKVYHDGIILAGVMEQNGKYVKNDIITSATNYYETYINDLYQYWPPDHLYKNNYINVREAALAYTLPKQLSNRLKLQKVTLTAAARNLFYLYKTVPNIDPEGALGAGSYVENTIYPSTREYSFGITVSF